MVLLICGMVAVTYLPRLLPFLLLQDQQLPAALRRYLHFLPPAALGALIVPGVFEAVPASPVASVAGALAALLSAWLSRSLVLSVLVAVAASFLALWVTG
jgi:branched-subunit amino acid transport protein